MSQVFVQVLAKDAQMVRKTQFGKEENHGKIHTKIMKTRRNSMNIAENQ